MNSYETSTGPEAIEVGNWKIGLEIEGNHTEVDYVEITTILGQMKRDLESDQTRHSFDISRDTVPSLRDARLLSRRAHCSIAIVNGGVLISDHDSTNGVYVTPEPGAQRHKMRNDPLHGHGVEHLKSGSSVHIPIDLDTNRDPIYLKLSLESIY